jgi:glycosyltransferase involved in cell wall biosynthesis
LRRDIDRSILFVAYHYPPDSSVGAKRIGRLASFLAKRGWRVGALTVKAGYHHTLDNSFEARGVTAYRTAMIESVRFLFRRLKRGGRTGGAGGGSGDGPGSFFEPSGERSGIIDAIKRFVLSLIWCPDDRHGWVIPGAMRGIGLLRRYRILYSSSPPHSVHLIPLILSRLSRTVRWVAEFRDPWTSFRKPPFAVSAVSDWLERRWERSVLARSDRVVVVNEAMKRDFTEKYPEYADKVVVYYNGYDTGDFTGIDMTRIGGERVVFTYAGSFYIGRSPEGLMRAVSNLVRRGTLDRGRILLQFIGDTSAGGSPIADIAARLDIGDCVRCLGPLPYRECLMRMAGSDVLLLFNINQPLQVPAKVFEYFALRKGILSISTGGITDEILERTGGGVSVSPDDMTALEGAVLDFVRERRYAGIEAEIERFDLSAIFPALADELEERLAR